MENRDDSTTVHLQYFLMSNMLYDSVNQGLGYLSFIIMMINHFCDNIL
jgi:hypothetical protein